MNSVRTVTINSVLNQNWVGCTVRTPKAQVASTLRAQCPGRGRCCDHNAQVARMSSAQPAQVARSACAGHAHSAQVMGACRDLPALPSQTAKVATSFPSRDLLEAIPCRDITFVSQHRSTLSRSRLQISCRDIVSPAQPQARSRLHFQVATSWMTNLCRDIIFMSRPRSCPA